MHDAFVEITENRKVNEKYYKLTFQSSSLARSVEPGHFLHLLVNPAQDPFLRRPFSYFRVIKDRIEVLYEILGRGTALLSKKTKGDTLKVMGPLGKPFTQKLGKNKKRVLIAGGVGVPPLIFLAEKFRTDYVLIGTKSKAEVLPKSELSKARGKILHATNDGSYGTKGFVTVLLRELIKKERPENLFIQTCGPTPMMQAVYDLAEEFEIDGEASVEKPMACGVGACLGCMVKTHDGWQASCIKGPVFSFKELVEM
jgi:dihydroorotate dehydrogenase electron transfer subunit